MNLYFDNAATSWPKPESVYLAMDQVLRKNRGNPGRSLGETNSRILFQTREALAELFHIPDSSRITFTLNATHAINLALMGYLQPGDRVVTTSLEHNAVSRPLRYLERTRRITLEIVSASPTGLIDPDDLRKALQSRTKLVVLNHASNVLGTVNDLERSGKIVRNAGAAFMVDCAQSAGSIPIDVQQAHIDILCGPGHKGLLGPSGTGFCYTAPHIRLDPLIFGGTGSHSELDTQPDTLPDRLESGTQNFQGLFGLLAGIKYILQRGIADIRRQEEDLMSRFIPKLNATNGLVLHGLKTAATRVPVFSITVPGVDPADIGNYLSEEFGIISRVGLHCAPWAHRTAGTFPEGTIRFSPGLFHTDSEVDFLAEAIGSAIRVMMK